MFDATTFWDFMRLLEIASLAMERQARVITDNAKYHHAKLHVDWRTA
jgi:hypothetical protein